LARHPSLRNSGLKNTDGSLELGWFAQLFGRDYFTTVILS